MIRKHIEHLTIESLKFFFNLDHTICNHIVLSVLVLFGMFRLFFNHTCDLFRDGLLTVKNDVRAIRSQIECYKERLQQRAM
jgi:hypothetical protein